MAQVTFSPPFTAPQDVASQLRQNGFAVLSPADVARWTGCALPELLGLNGDWAGLPPDDFLKDGGRYRRRRHACFVVQDGQVRQVPHRAHWQPVEYNALHGGMERWFAPMEPATVARPVWQQLLAALAGVSDAVFARSEAPASWFVEAHQFRIDTTDGIGRPTPEGAHRDGVDLVAVFLVGREGIKGGETRVFEAAGPSGQRFTLTEPWSLLLLDDARMIHESTPIQPLAEGGYRDTLVVTCRRGGFQGADVVGQAPAGR
ncbi:2OG-Fe dioxygenase family protein [Acidovorax sp. sif1233]|uniref:2OG-Fe dioxygenase family protein n=1 Tax=unclassified Acidovorax TaxID=2684926 RepID=UPI001C44A069|nr:MULTISPECIES: 2OG-Fe dioxygenase family protein [unclassified Acidovorax]MBV7426937.1 2OG-Fe dioxygenase family protein [Acidovorax sp. sif0732]MBV7448062.1 2OG-Fe dioxygenase family protein [Acidovorax sp. sif0715]MBV7455106.1 2OG-Fe dioxygenase family protein [Acidovorax sp. sif1233]